MRAFLKLSCFTVLAAGVLLSGCSKKAVELDDPHGSMTDDTSSEGTGGPGGSDPTGGTVETPTDEGGHLPTKIEDVFFSVDNYSLKPETRRALDGNAKSILAHPAWSITLEGHCDERGTVEYNLALGQKRADSARSYLADLGVPLGQLRSVSFGEERPFDLGHNEAAWSYNRRVHFVR